MDLGLIDDEFDDGTILKIEKAFNLRGDKWYNYAAIKVKGRWFVTGHQFYPGGMTTGEFIDWMTRGSKLMPAPRVYWAKTVYEI